MSDLFRIALGQMTVAETGTENLAKAVSLMKRAADAGARLLVLPEGVIARKPTDGAWSRKHAEPLDGPFVSGLLAATADIPIAVSCTVHEPSGAPTAGSGTPTLWRTAESFSPPTGSFISMTPFQVSKAPMWCRATPYRRWLI